MSSPANRPRGSYREIEHTADLAIEVTAPELAVLFATAAEAMFSVIVDPRTIRARQTVRVCASSSTPGQAGENTKYRSIDFVPFVVEDPSHLINGVLTIVGTAA